MQQFVDSYFISHENKNCNFLGTGVKPGWERDIEGKKRTGKGQSRTGTTLIEQSHILYQDALNTTLQN